MKENQFNTQLKNIHSQRNMSSVSSAQHDKHTCEICGFQTSQKTQLNLHKKVVHDERQFQCPECVYKLSSRSKLDNHHKSVHMGQKFQCQECEYKFSSKGSRAKHHKSIHMGQNSSAQIVNTRQVRKFT
jgi:predicted RNA-binding Zn-ribbon protein involved in translation (DUF1610 family)